MEYLHQCMSTEIEPIQKAGLLPTATHIETFSDALEQYGLGHGPKNIHKILLQFNDMASVKSDYFVCKQDPMVQIAKEIATFDLTIVSTVCALCTGGILKKAYYPNPGSLPIAGQVLAVPMSRYK